MDWLKLSNKLNTPEKVQRYLRSLPYNQEKKGETLRSAISAIQKVTCHCFEATFIAALLLEPHGYPPLVVSFESQDGLDHVIYAFQRKHKWGAVARSRDEGLHGRPAIFKNVRDLVESYYDPYVDSAGRITGYQLASLDDTGADWRASRKNVWQAEKYLLKLRHESFVSSDERYLKLYSDYLGRGPMPRKSFWW